MISTALVITFEILAWLCVLVTVLPFVPSRRWWIRVWDFPRLQIAAACFATGVPLLFAIGSGSWFVDVTTAAVGGALVYQLLQVWPYTAGAEQQAASADPNDDHATITILLSNVLQDNRDASRLLALIDRTDPDIVLVVETDEWWLEKLAPIRKTRPHVIGRPLDNTYGMILFSRFELEDVVMRELTSQGIPSVRATVMRDGQAAFTLYGVHPPPPFPAFCRRSTPRDAELVVLGREIADHDGPVIVAGDLNDVAWSATTDLFQRISGLLDPRRGRGMFNTFHTRYPFARWPLDHVFFSKDFTVVDVRRLDDIGSDHFPILIELAFVPSAAPAHDPPGPPDESERARADDIVDLEREDPAPLPARTTTRTTGPNADRNANRAQPA